MARRALDREQSTGNSKAEGIHIARRNPEMGRTSDQERAGNMEVESAELTGRREWPTDEVG